MQLESELATLVEIVAEEVHLSVVVAAAVARHFVVHQIENLGTAN